jgi:hypothetical protein
MSDPASSELASAMRATASAGLQFEERRENGADRFVLEAGHYRVEVSAEAGRHIGLKVEARSAGGASLIYEFDNDLYDIASDKHRAFGASLEADVLAFVNALAERKVLVGTTRGRLTMVIPAADHIAIVKRHRVGASTTTLVQSDMPPLSPDFVPLQEWRG